jgi:hypothetical protein
MLRPEGHRTVDELEDEIANEAGEWDRVFTAFMAFQEARQAQMRERHRLERAKNDLKWGSSLEVERLRKREQSLALEKRFKEAADFKARADALQVELAQKTLADRQRNETRVFQEHQQKGIAFIEAEREKIRKELKEQIKFETSRERRTRRLGKSAPVRRERAGTKLTLKSFEGLVLPGPASKKRSRTMLSSERGKWI